MDQTSTPKIYTVVVTARDNGGHWMSFSRVAATSSQGAETAFLAAVERSLPDVQSVKLYVSSDESIADVSHPDVEFAFDSRKSVELVKDHDLREWIERSTRDHTCDGKIVNAAFRDCGVWSRVTGETHAEQSA